MTKDKALKLAYKAEETGNLQDLVDAVNALIEALEQPAQEPNCYGDGNVYRGLRSEDSKVKTYHVNTHPHQWKRLTDDEIVWIAPPFYDEDNLIANEFGFARAIEQALKEKNT